MHPRYGNRFAPFPIPVRKPVRTRKNSPPPAVYRSDHSNELPGRASEPQRDRKIRALTREIPFELQEDHLGRGRLRARRRSHPKVRPPLQGDNAVALAATQVETNISRIITG